MNDTKARGYHPYEFCAANPALRRVLDQLSAGFEDGVSYLSLVNRLLYGQDCPADEYLLLGKVAKPQGLQGDLKIFLHSGQPENVAHYKELRLVDRDGVISPPLAVLSSRVQGKTAIVRLASITNRTEAEQVEGQGVLLARHHLPTVGENEYYWHQYQDKLVVDIAGNEIDLATTARIASDTGYFHVTFTKTLRQNGSLVREKTWTDHIPRRYQ